MVRSLYSGLKQIVETVLSQGEQNFEKAALMEYPRKGVWAICFISSKARGEVQASTDDDVVAVFMPTTPNPTSGFLLFVPRRGSYRARHGGRGRGEDDHLGGARLSRRGRRRRRRWRTGGSASEDKPAEKKAPEAAE